MFYSITYYDRTLGVERMHDTYDTEAEALKAFIALDSANPDVVYIIHEHKENEI